MKRYLFLAIFAGLFTTLGCEEPPSFEEAAPEGEPVLARYGEIKEEARAQSEEARTSIEESRTRMSGVNPEENSEEEP